MRRLTDAICPPKAKARIEQDQARRDERWSAFPFYAPLFYTASSLSIEDKTVTVATL